MSPEIIILFLITAYALWQPEGFCTIVMYISAFLFPFFGLLILLLIILGLFLLAGLASGMQ